MIEFRSVPQRGRKAMSVKKQNQLSGHVFNGHISWLRCPSQSSDSDGDEYNDLVLDSEIEDEDEDFDIGIDFEREREEARLTIDALLGEMTNATVADVADVENRFRDKEASVRQLFGCGC